MIPDVGVIGRQQIARVLVGALTSLAMPSSGRQTTNSRCSGTTAGDQRRDIRAAARRPQVHLHPIATQRGCDRRQCDLNGI